MGYTGHFSAASKMFQQQFESMAAAYDAEVEDVPSVVILPLGLKPDGSHYDKTDMVVVAPEVGAFNEVIPRAKAAIDAITVLDDEGERQPWQFDPNTGTTLPPPK